jgi:hypothetical protein
MHRRRSSCCPALAVAYCARLAHGVAVYRKLARITNRRCVRCYVVRGSYGGFYRIWLRRAEEIFFWV